MSPRVLFLFPFPSFWLFQSLALLYLESFSVVFHVCFCLMVLPYQCVCRFFYYYYYYYYYYYFYYCCYYYYGNNYYHHPKQPLFQENKDLSITSLVKCSNVVFRVCSFTTINLLCIFEYINISPPPISNHRPWTWRAFVSSFSRTNPYDLTFFICSRTWTWKQGAFGVFFSLVYIILLSLRIWGAEERWVHTKN